MRYVQEKVYPNWRDRSTVRIKRFDDEEERQRHYVQKYVENVRKVRMLEYLEKRYGDDTCEKCQCEIEMRRGRESMQYWYVRIDGAHARMLVDEMSKVKKEWDEFHRHNPA